MGLRLDNIGEGVYIGAKEPSKPHNGTLWLDEDKDTLYVYYTNSWWSLGYFPQAVIPEDAFSGTPMPFGGMLHLTYP